MIVLETERLYLREWVPDDWLRFKPLVVDPRVVEYIKPGEPWSDDRIENRVREYIQLSQTRGWILWPVIHRADTKLIGFCGFSDGFPPDVEIGWRLLPEYWGQGLATEAATATLEYGFATWNFPRVIAVAQDLNRASIRVMEKIGMTFDGMFIHEDAEVVRYAVENPRFNHGGRRNEFDFENLIGQCAISFAAMAWQEPVPYCRTKECVRGGRRIRLVEFQKGFEEYGWCEKGHVGFIVEGSLDIEFPEKTVQVKAGDGVWIPAGHETRHRAHVVGESVQLMLIEDIAGG
jgi:ribosomal-protein-alanine N-acetyltransferase